MTPCACVVQSCNGKHEAEEAQLAMPPVPITHGESNSASGTGFIQFFGTGSESVTFNLEACDAGPHQLIFTCDRPSSPEQFQTSWPRNTLTPLLALA